MSDQPEEEAAPPESSFKDAEEPKDEAASKNPDGPARVVLPKLHKRWRRPLVLALIALLAVTGIGLAGWALLFPRPEGLFPSLRYSDAQRADAKIKACSAFRTVRTGVTRNTTLIVPNGEADFAGNLAATANARIALFNGGQYLLNRLDPATPSPLAETVRDFANGLMDVGASATAGTVDSDPIQGTRLTTLEAANSKIAGLCV